MNRRIKKSKFFINVFFTIFTLCVCLSAVGLLVANQLIGYRCAYYILCGIAAFFAFLGIANAGYFLTRDYLTGVLNKDFYLKCLIFLMITKKLSLYTVAFINIKGMTYINEHYSSNTGDKVIKKFASVINSFTQRGEYVSRLGGDNFMVLIKKNRVDEFLSMLSDLTLYVEIEAGSEVPIKVGSNCGLYNLTASDTIRDVMNNSGIAIRQAKKSVKEDFVWFEPEMLSTIIHENTIINSFRDAIEKEEFLVYYQPKVDIVTGKLDGAEALVRWSKNGKMVPPMDFIPVFEREGLVTELDFYVFERVCKDLVEWEKKGIPIVTVSSNFSKLHIRNPNFAKSVVDVINKYQTKSYSLEIELTESGANENFEVFKHFIDEIHNAGIKISIDDFGTGYSSLSLLKNIDADVVKLDKSFIDNVHDDKSADYNLVCNLVKLIKDLGCDVICEGVETVDQASLMKKAGCSLIQGYFFDKPLPHDEFEQRLIKKEYKV